MTVDPVKATEVSVVYFVPCRIVLSWVSTAF